MTEKQNIINNTTISAILNSYSVIFFMNNRLLAIVLLLASFINFFAGLSGLLAVLITVMISKKMGLNENLLKQGLFSFNALLTGIGMGTFFDPSLVFFTLLALASLLTLILSVTFGGWLGKYNLPVLSLPFVITFWFIVLPSSQFENLGLTQRNIFWMNDVYGLGGMDLLHFFQTIDALPVHKMLDIYLRSLSSIFFQSNLVTGLLISITLLICSRIFFSLSIVGFLSAYFFAQFSGSEAASITYYNIGANYMMVAFAIGGFFLIPSRSSYLWTILLVPLTSLVLLFFNKLLGFIQLPVFSLPFSFIVILFVYFLQMRTKTSKLVLTPLQFYSPEINLYTYNNNIARLSHFLYTPIYLPFWGEWTVTQGHDGEYTHIGDWGKAFDFMIYGENGKTFSSNGLVCQDYYCYNKPIVAPADGIVEEIIDNINDNEIGKVNTTNNWGNSIIIRHAPGLYSQMSHLKQGSFKVVKGAYLKKGDIIASCGNSGRSPEPHLHFQLQSLPTLGAKTLEYPFAYYFNKNDKKPLLEQFSKPIENSLISGIYDNAILKSSFDILPNRIFKFSFVDTDGEEKIENWESYTDAYNYKYLYCKETEAVAYYVNDNQMFYFTAYYGDKKSLLYYFYLSAYKVFLGNGENMTLTDVMPINTLYNNKIQVWIHDFIAPFYNYIKVGYSINSAANEDVFETSSFILNSDIQLTTFNKKRDLSKSSIMLKDNYISEFIYSNAKIKIHAKCIN